MNNQKPLNEQEALDAVKRSHKPKSVPDTIGFATRLEQFEAETRRRKISRKRMVGVIGGVALINILFFAFVMLSHDPVGRILCTFNAIIDAELLYTGLADLRTAVSSEALIRATEGCGPQAIGPFLARHDAFPYSKERRLLWEAITRLLKRISLEEADALPREVRARLNQRLYNIVQVEGVSGEGHEFSLAWLKVLEQIGNKQDVRVVEFLARQTTGGVFYNTVRRAAQECLPHIEARIAAQESGRTLLRASTLPTDSGETLLRPAAKSNPTAPNELLRPVEPEEDSGKS